MRGRSSADRLEALSLEIERKLQKVPVLSRPFSSRGGVSTAGPIRKGGAFCGVHFVPGVARLLNVPLICIPRG
jgi:hypothetical protein